MYYQRIYEYIYELHEIEYVCEIHICRQAVGLLRIDYYYCYSCIAVKLCFGLLIGPVVKIMTFLYMARYWSVLFLTFYYFTL